MKAKLLRRIRKNWAIGIDRTEKTFPSRIAVSKNDEAIYYEYDWAYRRDFIKLLLKLSGLGSIKTNFIYNNYLDRHYKRQKRKLKNHRSAVKANLLNKISR